MPLLLQGCRSLFKGFSFLMLGYRGEQMETDILSSLIQHMYCNCFFWQRSITHTHCSRSATNVFKSNLMNFWFVFFFLFLNLEVATAQLVCAYVHGYVILDHTRRCLLSGYSCLPLSTEALSGCRFDSQNRKSPTSHMWHWFLTPFCLHWEHEQMHSPAEKSVLS